jgi:formate dehydrogenase maturation protein FdhE
MEKDLLQAVIKVESAIQKSIETERKKAAEWLESVRVSLSQALEAKKQQLEEEYARSLESTCMECEIKAQKEVKNVNEMVENLQNITDEMLQEIVRGFLQDILPAEKR